MTNDLVPYHGIVFILITNFSKTCETLSNVCLLWFIFVFKKLFKNIDWGRCSLFLTKITFQEMMNSDFSIFISVEEETSKIFFTKYLKTFVVSYSCSSCDQ